MTLQQLLILAGLTDRGTDPRALLGNFQNPFDLMSGVTTPPPFAPTPTTPTPTPTPTPAPVPPPPIAPTSPLRELMVDGGGIEDFNPALADMPMETRAMIDPTMPDPYAPGFTADFPGTPGFAASALGHALTMGLSAIPTAGPFLGLAARMIGLPSIIAQFLTPNISLIPDYLINDPLNPMSPTLSLDIDTIGPSPAFSDFEALSSAPDEPGAEGEGEGEGEGDGGDE